MRDLKAKLADLELNCVCDRSKKSQPEGSLFDQFTIKAKSAINDLMTTSPNSKASFLENASSINQS